MVLMKALNSKEAAAISFDFDQPVNNNVEQIRNDLAKTIGEGTRSKRSATTGNWISPPVIRSEAPVPMLTMKWKQN
jgi:hypothetical protein